MDQHYDGEALRFPDFLRLAQRLTERHTEEDLGVVRASLRLKRREDEAAGGLISLLSSYFSCFFKVFHGVSAHFWWVSQGARAFLEAEAWARRSRRPMSRAGSLFFKQELDIQRIKSQ